jgi:hypothetical protein
MLSDSMEPVCLFVVLWFIGRSPGVEIECLLISRDSSYLFLFSQVFKLKVVQSRSPVV